MLLQIIAQLQERLAQCQQQQAALQAATESYREEVRLGREAVKVRAAQAMKTVS